MMKLPSFCGVFSQLVDSSLSSIMLVMWFVAEHFGFGVDKRYACRVAWYAFMQVWSEKTTQNLFFAVVGYKLQYRQPSGV